MIQNNNFKDGLNNFTLMTTPNVWLAHFRKLFITLHFLLSLLLSCHAQSFDISQIPLSAGTEHNAENWQQIAINPLSPQQFFITNAQGQLHIIDQGELLDTPVLDLSSYYPQLLEFTAFSTHPSFNIEHQMGALTFYTAHIESNTTPEKTSKIKAYKFPDETPYELVLTEWQFINKKNQSLTLDQASRREVLRISVPSTKVTIKQLAFNPFIQSWQDNYSHLFIALGVDEQYANFSLYSGAVLRISPKKFGSKQYRIPKSNPFTEQVTINNETLTAGLASINTLHWLKQHPNELLINHNVGGELTLSKLQTGNDFTKSSTEAKKLYTMPYTHASNSIIYRGGTFKKYRNKLLYLVWNNVWQLASISPQASRQTEVIHSFTELAIDGNAAIFLSVDHQGGLLALDQTNNILFKFTPTINGAPVDTHDDNNRDANEQYFAYLILLIAFLVFIAMTYWSKRSSLPVIKKMLHEQFARFEINELDKTVALFKRHQGEPTCQLSLSDIKKSIIYLNDTKICLVSSEPDEAFSNAKEHEISTQLLKEKREKMIDDRIRKYELEILDNNNKVYRICHYFRKGNQRLTKTKFDDATQQLIDWCWQVSVVINPTNTEKRKITVKAKLSPSTANKLAANSNRSQQKPSAKVLSNEQTKPVEASDTKITPTASTPRQTPTTGEHIANSVNHQPPSAQTSSTDLAIVEGLEKLAKLKQQDLLSDAEFEEAKSKLLNLQR